MPDVKPDVLKRLAELVDGDGWEIADLLAEEFPAETFGDNGSSRRTELHAALELYEDALRKQSGVILKATTMRTYRATALAWHVGDRTPRASFDAHRRLRGKDGPQRLSAYLNRNDGRPLSGRDVQRYRADDNPKPVKAWDQRARKRIASTVKSLLLGGIIPKDQERWWDVDGVDESRALLSEMLRELANKLDGAT